MILDRGEKKTIEFKYLLFNENLYNFDSIVSFANSYNNNVNIVHLKLGYRLTKYPFSTIKYNMYIHSSCTYNSCHISWYSNNVWIITYKR